MNIDYQKLIQGRYEVERLPADFSRVRIVPDFAFNVLNPLGLLYRPVADEHFLENGGKRPVWPEGKPFAVCLTHDVDIVSLYSQRQIIRGRKAQLSMADTASKKIKSLLGFGVDLCRMAKHHGMKDPLFCYERWIEVEKEVGAHSTFFFWPGCKSITKPHHTDCAYELDDHIIFDNQRCTVTEMMQEIDRMGWDIGLHPSWYSFDDADALKRQKDAVEKALGHEIVSVRQHYLHYDCRVTPKTQADTGFKYDSTLGFNDNVGFRFGTCYPYFLYDLKADKELPIMEIPLIMQDVAMLNPSKGMRLDGATAFHYVIHLAACVEEFGGVFTLLWHPSHIIKPGWWNLYIRILKCLQPRKPWFASVREIGEWWGKKSIKAGCLKAHGE